LKLNKRFITAVDVLKVRELKEVHNDSIYGLKGEKPKFSLTESALKDKIS